MQPALRLVFSFAICVSIPLAILPAQSAIPQIKKADCCAKAKAATPANNCDQHAPKSEPDKQCCAACIYGLGLFLSTATPFVYPPTGEESFATLSVREQVRSHRPPVPPPRLSEV
jgi:hypothetical protein